MTKSSLILEILDFQRLLSLSVFWIIEVMLGCEGVQYTPRHVDDGPVEYLDDLLLPKVLSR